MVPLSSRSAAGSQELGVHELEPGLVRDGPDAGRPCVRVGLDADRREPAEDSGSRGTDESSDVDQRWPVDELVAAVLAWPTARVELRLAGEPPSALDRLCRGLLRRGRQVVVESDHSGDLGLGPDTRRGLIRRRICEASAAAGTLRGDALGTDSGTVQLVPAIRSVADLELLSALGSEAEGMEILLRPGPEVDREELLAALIELGERHPAARDWRIGPSEPAPIAALDRYDLLEELGAGGMGTIYRARHRELGLEVALKMHRCGPDSSPRQAGRLRQEARLLARLDHPAIVRAVDAGSDRGTVFLAMECIRDAVTLSERLRKRDRRAAGFDPGSPLSLRARLSLTARLCDAVEHVHGRGILHRDIKPANVLVRPDGAPVLIDFGLAIDASQRARARRRVGTAGYMAPEVLAGEGATARSDLWSLGALLFRVVTGRRPWRSATPAESLAIIRSEPLRFRKGRRPRGLKALIRALLAVDPAARPARAADVAESLRALVAELE